MELSEAGRASLKRYLERRFGVPAEVSEIEPDRLPSAVPDLARHGVVTPSAPAPTEVASAGVLDLWRLAYREPGAGV